MGFVLIGCFDFVGFDLRFWLFNMSLLDSKKHYQNRDSDLDFIILGWYDNPPYSPTNTMVLEMIIKENRVR